MGLFFSIPKSLSEEVQKRMADAMKVPDPIQRQANLQAAIEASEAAKSAPQQFNWGRALMTLVIAVLLVVGSVLTAQNSLPDISKVLINCVPAYFGAILTLLVGELQKK